MDNKKFSEFSIANDINEIEYLVGYKNNNNVKLPMEIINSHISKGDNGETGPPGYTPIKGVDYFDGLDGVDGVTFTPAMSDEGILSWSNDGDRENPVSINIKGPKGDSGDGSSSSRLTGKRLWLDGDSWASSDQLPYVNILFQRLGLSEINVAGTNGSTVSEHNQLSPEQKANSLCGKIKAGYYTTALAGYDMIAIMMGVNDYGGAGTMGTLDSQSTETFVGAMRYAINYFKTNFPTVELIWIVQPYLNPQYIDWVPFPSWDIYRRVLISICASEGCQYIDTQSFMGFNDQNLIIYAPDKLHLGEFGGVIFGNKLAENIEIGGSTIEQAQTLSQVLAQITLYDSQIESAQQYIELRYDPVGRELNLDSFDIEILAENGIGNLENIFLIINSDDATDEDRKFYTNNGEASSLMLPSGNHFVHHKVAGKLNNGKILGASNSLAVRVNSENNNTVTSSSGKWLAEYATPISGIKTISLWSDIPFPVGTHIVLKGIVSDNSDNFFLG